MIKVQFERSLNLKSFLSAQFNFLNLTELFLLLLCLCACSVSQLVGSVDKKQKKFKVKVKATLQQKKKVLHYSFPISHVLYLSSLFVSDFGRRKEGEGDPSKRKLLFLGRQTKHFTSLFSSSVDKGHTQTLFCLF